jgi:AcrR family transcriptional regulator
MTVLSRRDSICSMTIDTADYRDRPMATTGRDDARAALLAAAHDLLAKEGPSGLSVRRIAAAAGMSTMNVYSRFGGKDGVLDELFIDGFRRMGEEMGESPTSDDAGADLLACSEAYRAFAKRNPTYYSLMFDRVVPDFEPSPHAIEIALAALDRVTTRVRRAMEAGVIRQGDPFEVATALWACQHGVASLEARAMGDDEEPFDWDAVSAIVTASLVRGLAP